MLRNRMAALLTGAVFAIMPQLVLAQKYELTSEEIGRTTHIHPTMSEAMKEAAEGLMGEMINL